MEYGKISEVFKETLGHSIAQTFLAYSGLLVAISISLKLDESYVQFSLITLIFAMANFKIEAIRKVRRWASTQPEINGGLSYTHAHRFPYSSGGVW